jgi:hypothetical protein
LPVFSTLPVEIGQLALAIESPFRDIFRLEIREMKSRLVRFGE